MSKEKIKFEVEMGIHTRDLVGKDSAYYLTHIYSLTYYRKEFLRHYNISDFILYNISTLRNIKC